MRYTQKELLGDFNHFKAFLFGLDKIVEGVTMLQSPKGYERHWDYIRKCVAEMCPMLSEKFIDEFYDAVCDIARDHIEEGLRTKKPLPKDFDSDRYYFDHMVEYLEKVRRRNAEQERKKAALAGIVTAVEKNAMEKTKDDEYGS